MSIIQKIREKAAWLVFGVIGLSLLGFLLMDAFVGRGGAGLMRGQSTSLGSVNGTKIEYADFLKKKTALEGQYRQSGYPVNEMMEQNIQEQVWNQYIEENVLKGQYKTLGLNVSPKELSDILFGSNPPQALKQQFTDPATGRYDANGARSAIDNLRKMKNENSQQFEEQFLPALVEQRLKDKYTALLANTAYIPKWMIEKQNTDNNEIASISFVNAPYSLIPDSTIKVTDSDINSYVSNHKEEYKQPESRTISYVVFNAAPSSKDSADIFNELVQMKSEFASSTDVPTFLISKGSETNFLDAYVLKSKLQVPNALVIQELQDGQVFGPYLDATNFTLAKMISKRSMPDSIKVRHILINTQNGAIPDSVAKRRIDSIETAIKNGSDFAQLAKQFSDDQGSKENGGEYEMSSQQFSTLAKEFAEFAFYGSPGQKKVVKTLFGYHYMEVISQKNFEEAYKIAYMSKAIVASQETQNTASGMANQFAGESRSAKAFDENIIKNKYAKLTASDIKPVDNMIPALGSSRQLVKWIYSADKGEVSEPYDMGDKYIVAEVVDINEEGTMNAAKARPQAEFIVRNQKKADELIRKIGNANTLQAVATAVGGQVLRADSISFASPVIPNIGQEPKVIGYSFNKEAQAKMSAPIAGNGGVFVIKRENLSAKANLGINIEQQRQSTMAQLKSMSGFRSLEALKKAADVKDQRSKIL
ncbi:MAG: SurA N-terminal domain-containing protein [Chitinophagaceae bacterium]